jgi:glutathione S-transferase
MYANLCLSNQKAPYTDKQPFGVIPVLEDGDFRLYGK